MSGIGMHEKPKAEDKKQEGREPKATLPKEPMAQNAEDKKQEKGKEQQAQEKIPALEAEKRELVETLQSVQAEFENYKKRVEKEKPQWLQLGKAGAVAELLPLLDSFDAAEEKLKKEKRQDSGIELLHKQLAQATQRIGLKEIKALGEKFSHETMDCMMQGNEKEKGEGIVLEEFQKGYSLDGIVLRHAKVKVNKLEEVKEK